MINGKPVTSKEDDFMTFSKYHCIQSIDPPYQADSLYPNGSSVWKETHNFTRYWYLVLSWYFLKKVHSFWGISPKIYIIMRREKAHCNPCQKRH